MPEILTKLRKYVVCIDTMGQDRQFTHNEKKMALNAVFKFRNQWENFEKEQLIHDRDALLKE